MCGPSSSSRTLCAHDDPTSQLISLSQRTSYYGGSSACVGCCEQEVRGYQKKRSTTLLGIRQHDDQPANQVPVAIAPHPPAPRCHPPTHGSMTHTPEGEIQGSSAKGLSGDRYFSGDHHGEDLWQHFTHGVVKSCEADCEQRNDFTQILDLATDTV